MAGVSRDLCRRIAQKQSPAKLDLDQRLKYSARGDRVFGVLESAGLSAERFIADETLKGAFVRSLSIIGEATKKVPDKVYATEPTFKAHLKLHSLPLLMFVSSAFMLKVEVAPRRTRFKLNENTRVSGGEGGGRTHTLSEQRQILSLVRLPVPPLRHG